MNKTIIVFGATGTLGAPIAIHLKQKGYNVIAIGHRQNDNGFFYEHNIPYISFDITRDSFKNLPQKDIYAVVHFAGPLPASMKGYNAQLYIDGIIKGTYNILEYARSVKADRIVFPQSLFDISYLFGSRMPINPDAERKAPATGDHAMYVIAKNAAVDMIEHYYHTYGLKRFILRLSRIYLYHPNPYTYTDGEKTMISDRLLIYKAMKSEPIEIWGDPTRVLETICIADFLQIVEKSLSAKNDGGIYNVGSGGSTLEERIRGIVDVFSPEGAKSEISYCPEKRNSTQFLLDIEKTKRELGYEPHYSWKDYLLLFKKDMEQQPFARLWGTEEEHLLKNAE